MWLAKLLQTTEKKKIMDEKYKDIIEKDNKRTVVYDILDYHLKDHYWHGLHCVTCLNLVEDLFNFLVKGEEVKTVASKKVVKKTVAKKQVKKNIKSGVVSEQ